LSLLYSHTAGQRVCPALCTSCGIPTHSGNDIPTVRTRYEAGCILDVMGVEQMRFGTQPLSCEYYQLLATCTEDSVNFLMSIAASCSTMSFTHWPFVLLFSFSFWFVERLISTSVLAKPFLITIILNHLVTLVLGAAIPQTRHRLGNGSCA